jgi:hypothetical protein
MKLDINALKEKIMELIPFGKKGEVEVDVEETAEGEEVDVEVKVKEGEEEIEEEEEEDDEEAAAKKKKGLYIKVAAGIVIAFFALDEMTKDTQEAPKRAPVKKSRAKKKKAKKPKKAPKKKVAEKKKAKPPAKKVEAPAPVVVKEKKPVKRDISSVQPTPPVKPTPPSGPPKAEKEPEELALEVEEIVEEIGTPTEEELKGPAEYVVPPDYSEVGRGLVYNCKGKHWACVDKNSYFACRDNLKWAKENGKGFECFTKDVYRNERDCRVIQTHFINTNLKTDFCK